jgi:flagellar basal-body rod protein FlgF
LDNIAYIGLSRQMTLRRALDITANNIANADTTGFKVEQLMVATKAGPPAKDAELRASAKFVLDNGVGRDFSQGEMKKTGASLDVALEGSGFFSVQTPQGVRYTRDGHFSANSQGQLVNSQGDPVLDDSGGTIQFDPLQPAPSISVDGVVTQGSLRIGRIGVVDFPSASVLSKQGDNLYSNTSNAQPAPAANARMQQGFLEGSNVKPVLEITNLIQIQRAYEQVAQLISTTNDLSQQAIDRLAKITPS